MPFILRDPRTTGDTTIHLHVYLSDGRLKYPTGEKVRPANWNQAAGRAVKDRARTNIVLNRIETRLQELVQDAKIRGVPLTRSAVKAALDELLHRKPNKADFWAVIDGIITAREAGEELTTQGKRFSWHTIKGYRHSRDQLYRFDPGLTFESITLDTYNRLVAFFNERDHAVNSTAKIIKNLKVFMGVAYAAGVHQNPIFRKFRMVEEQTYDIYLTMEELGRMYRHNFPGKTLDLARDWFILDCLTGLRISDIKMLGQEHIDGDYIKLHNEKTDIKVVVPLHPWVKAILKKHKGLPRKISDQRMNRYIKDVALIAGIRGKETYSVTKGGYRRDYYLERWQMVSNHSARRSFITNLLKAGVPHTQVMKLAGIRKMETLMKYDKLSAEENAAMLKGHGFFSGSGD